MSSPPPLGFSYLQPCPSCRVSQVPWRFFGYVPPPTTPDGPAPRSCYPLAPVAGFPISWEGRRRQDLSSRGRIEFAYAAACILSRF